MVLTFQSMDFRHIQVCPTPFYATSCATVSGSRARITHSVDSRFQSSDFVRILLRSDRELAPFFLRAPGAFDQLSLINLQELDRAYLDPTMHDLLGSDYL